MIAFKHTPSGVSVSVDGKPSTTWDKTMDQHINPYVLVELLLDLGVETEMKIELERL
jgi:hypothetical protein